jgi:hypothetical protein
MQQTANETKEIIRRTASETAVVTLQMAGNINDVKRVSFLSCLFVPEPHLFTQGASCRIIFKNGCVHQTLR